MKYKFRAWDKEDKRMYGFDFDMVEDSIFPSNEKHFEDYEVMLFIGLTDKNGKEIYEGDIVITPDSNGEPIRDTGVVIYENCEFIVDYGWKKMGCSWLRDVEKIGNKFENPELLEGKK